MRPVAWSVLLCCACGRIAFDPLDDGGGTDGIPANDGALTGDGSIPTIPCADMNLGSAVGSNVASGTTSNANNAYQSCNGTGYDLTFGWFAPASGMYQIDVCASRQDLDTTLSVRMGSCTGAELACDDDSCGPLGIQSRVTVNLTAGQGVVIIVDEVALMGPKPYQLAITQL